MEAAKIPSTSWEPGEVVGQCSLLGRIAVGGMAEIWLARQVGIAGFQRVVVIKRISDEFSEDQKFVEMFLDEARIAAQLSHPNVVQIYDLGQFRGAYFITMEYLHGEDLGSVVRKSVSKGAPLPLTHAVRIIANAADGLTYAHDRSGMDGKPLNIVHRDVSPQNVIVTYDGNVKLLDFGIAKARSRATRTMDGSIKGKVNYLSPEQARGDPLDARSDVFSLGIVLYEAVGRCRLFNYDDAHMNLLAITGTGEIPPPSALNPEVPAELDAIVLKAVARPLDQRYATARQLQIALEDWLRRRADSPGTFEISNMMKGLFPDRIAKRTKLIESAMRGEAAPATLDRALEAPSEPVVLTQAQVKTDPAPAGTLPVSNLVGATFSVPASNLTPAGAASAGGGGAVPKLEPGATGEVYRVATVIKQPGMELPATNLAGSATQLLNRAADPEEGLATAQRPQLGAKGGAVPSVDPEQSVITDPGLLTPSPRVWPWVIFGVGISSVIAAGIFFWMRHG